MCFDMGEARLHIEYRRGKLLQGPHLLHEAVGSGAAEIPATAQPAAIQSKQIQIS